MSIILHEEDVYVYSDKILGTILADDIFLTGWVFLCFGVGGVVGFFWELLTDQLLKDSLQLNLPYKIFSLFYSYHCVT